MNPNIEKATELGQIKLIKVLDKNEGEIFPIIVKINRLIDPKNLNETLNHIGFFKRISGDCDVLPRGHLKLMLNNFSSEFTEIVNTLVSTKLHNLRLQQYFTNQKIETANKEISNINKERLRIEKLKKELKEKQTELNWDISEFEQQQSKINREISEFEQRQAEFNQNRSEFIQWKRETEAKLNTKQEILNKKLREPVAASLLNKIKDLEADNKRLTDKWNTLTIPKYQTIKSTIRCLLSDWRGYKEHNNNIRNFGESITAAVDKIESNLFVLIKSKIQEEKELDIRITTKKAEIINLNSKTEILTESFENCKLDIAAKEEALNT